MRRQLFAALAAGLIAAPTGAFAQAPVAVRSVRVGAGDVFKTATFYQAVFGLKEIRRVDRPDLQESILNFGATVAEANANTGVKVVVISRPKGAPAVDPVSHLIFQVTNAADLVTKAKAAGGTVEREATRSATSGSMVAFVVDPSGNRIELIQPAP